MRNPILKSGFGRARYVLLAVAALVWLGACGDPNGPVEDLERVQGAWLSEEWGVRDHILVGITPGKLTLYERFSHRRVTPCYGRHAFAIEPLGGGRFVLVDEETEERLTVWIRLDAGVLTIEDEEGFVLSFEPSNEELATRYPCVGGGADASFTCSELPEIQLGDTVAGELTTTDHHSGGRYFDLYQYTEETPVDSLLVTAASDQIGLFAYVYDSDGALLDDTAPAPDVFARVHTFAGCYRVEVTSEAEGATGPYTLSITGSTDRYTRPRGVRRP